MKITEFTIVIITGQGQTSNVNFIILGGNRKR